MCWSARFGEDGKNKKPQVKFHNSSLTDLKEKISSPLNIDNLVNLRKTHVK
jgi:hypothetical protein